jgi:hypothetical protein
MDMPAGDVSRGSTSSRLLGASALTAAATLCAVGFFITLLVFVHAWVDSLAGPVAALAALTGTFGALALSGFLVARAIAKAAARRAQLERALKELEERRREAEVRRELEARREGDGESESMVASLAEAAGMPHLGPWIRVASAAAPVVASLVALVGPVRIARMAVRGYSAWRAYQALQDRKGEPEHAKS